MKSLLPTAQKTDLYAIPFLKYKIENLALCDELKRVIEKKMGESNAALRTNVGGWQSEKDLPEWQEPCIQEFLKLAHDLVKEMVLRTVSNPTDKHLEGWKIEAFANVNTEGSYNKPHHHGTRNIWSGILYIDSGDHSTGATKFQDRSGVAKDPNAFSGDFSVQPEKGLMILFPATLVHYVEPYEGMAKRITLPFNFKHDGFKVPTVEVERISWMKRNFRGIYRSVEIIAETLGLKKKEYDYEK